MQAPLIRTTMIAAFICLAFTRGYAQAQEARLVFEFPNEVGRLQLYDQLCTDERILNHYASNIPDPFFTDLPELRGRIVDGCWYMADERVFFTDSELDLFAPLPAVE